MSEMSELMHKCLCESDWVGMESGRSEQTEALDTATSPHKGDWVKCVTRTRTRVGKPALGFYESLENIYSSKTNAIKA